MAVDQLKTRSTGAFADLRRHSRVNLDYCQRLSGLGMVSAEQLAEICSEREAANICGTRRLGNTAKAPTAFWIAKYESAPGRISGWGVWSQIFENNHTSWWNLAERSVVRGLCCLWDPYALAAAGTDARMLALNDPFAALRMQLRQVSAGEKELPLTILPTVPGFKPCQPVHTLNRKLTVAGEGRQQHLLQTAAKLDAPIWLPPSAGMRLETGQRNTQLRKFQVYCKNAKPWPHAFIDITKRKSPQETIQLAHDLHLTQDALATIMTYAPQLRELLTDTWQQVGPVEHFTHMYTPMVRRLDGIYRAGTNKLITNAIVTVKEITEYGTDTIRYRGSIAYCGSCWDFETYEDLPHCFLQWLRAEVDAQGLPPYKVADDWRLTVWSLMLRLSPDIQYTRGESRVGWSPAAQALLLPNGAIKLHTGWTDADRVISNEPLPGSAITASRHISGDHAKLLQTRSRAVRMYWLLQLYLLTHLVSRPTLTEMPPLAIGIRDQAGWVAVQRIFESLGFLPPVDIADAYKELHNKHDWPLLLNRITQFTHPLPPQGGFIAPMPWYAAEVLALTRPMFVTYCTAPDDDVLIPAEASAAVTSHVLQEMFTTNFVERYLPDKCSYRNMWLKVRWQTKYAMLDAGSSGRTALAACAEMLRPIDGRRWTTARAVCRLMLRLIDTGLYKFIIADNNLQNIETPHTVALLADGSVLVPYRILPMALRLDAGITVPSRQIGQQMLKENTLLNTLRPPHGNATFWHLPKKSWQAAVADVRTTKFWNLRTTTKELLNDLWPK